MATGRRQFLSSFGRAAITGVTSPLWASLPSQEAMAQSPAGPYKAIVVISLTGGNDSNNMLIPLDTSRYAQYASLRPTLAIPSGACLPLRATPGGGQYGLHPSMPNIASLFNNRRALFVANVGPKDTPSNKAQMLASLNLTPQDMFSHPAGLNQMESASDESLPTSGWGGRIGDLLVSQSGSLPPVINTVSSATFTVGRSVQAIAVRAAVGAAAATSIPSVLTDGVSALASLDSRSPNKLVSQVAALRAQALQQQTLLNQAQLSGVPLSTVFPQTKVGQELYTVANVLKGTRNVIGASRQIFYAQHGPFDTHGTQAVQHNNLLAELDGALGAFMSALSELGLSNQVIVCTLSDFNRTMVENSSQGTDHAWGSHQLILGGGIAGGRILGTYPDLDIGGGMDWTNGSGVWVPTTSVVEMAAGVGAWMGLLPSELQDVFPTLSRFPSGALSLT